MADTRTELPRIRQQRGISAAQVARLAGVSRQTIYAIEAGDYVPNTTLALQLARILEVRVEDLFQLEGGAAALPKPVTVELLGEGASKGQPVQLCQVGRRFIGVAAVLQPVLPMADGVVVGTRMSSDKVHLHGYHSFRVARNRKSRREVDWTT